MRVMTEMPLGITNVKVDGPRRSFQSSGNIAGLLTALATVIALRPDWMSDLPQDSEGFMVLHQTWMYASALCVSALIFGASIRSALVESAHERVKSEIVKKPLGEVAEVTHPTTPIPSKPGETI